MTDRRSFLSRSASVAVLGGIMPAGFMNAAFAQTLPTLGNAVDPENVLVVVQLAGGNDGLNTVVPYADDNYYRVRPQINVAADKLLKLDDHVALNPALSGMMELYKQGHVALMQGVGYPNPNRSHFEATQIWETASVDRPIQTGWLGRYLDAAMQVGARTANPFGAVSLGDTLPAALVGAHTDVPAIGALNNYAFQTGKNLDQKSSAGMLYDGAKPGQSPYLQMVEDTARNAYHGGDRLRSLLAGYTTTVAYPGDNFSQQLKLAAQLIGSKAGTRIIFVSLGSFDTHANQRVQQDRLLGYLGTGLKAFYDDLKAHGNDKRVLTMTFSEFGRRVSQNASGGTDHGTAAPVFVVGGALKGGIYGAHPSLTDLDKNGDLLHSQDFRAIYATVLERWLGRSSRDVLAGTYAPIAFV